MFGYIFEVTNKKTGETYLGKRYSVKFDKDYLGEDDDKDLATAVDKYGKSTFEAKMIMPYDTQVVLDSTFADMTKSRKKAKPVETEPVEEKPAKTTRKKKSAEEE